MRKVAAQPVVRFIVIFASAIMSFGLIRTLVDTWQKGDVVGKQRSELEAIERQHAELENKLKEATSSSFVEREARNKLGFIKEGETVILMGTPTPEENGPQNSTGTPLSRWEKWWKLFF